MTEPAPSVRFDDAPAASREMTPLEASEPTDSDCAFSSVKAPTVPVALTAPILLAPVRLTMPAPLAASAAAVMTPAPFSVAPEATEVVSVPPPTLREPEIVTPPALTVVAPV